MDKRRFKVVIRTSDLPATYIVWAENFVKAQAHALDLFKQTVAARFCKIYGAYAEEVQGVSL